MYKEDYRVILYISFLIFLVFLPEKNGYSNPISPDGSLADWKGVKPISLNEEKYIVYNKSLWTGPKDLSAKLYLYTSKRNLYVGIDIQDGSLVYSKKETVSSILGSDHIEVWIDTYPQRKNKTKMDRYVHQFIFDIANKNCIELYPKKVFYIKTIKYRSKKTKKGYIFEVKIPGFILNSLHPYIKEMGILIDVIDIDKGEKTKQGTFLSTSPKRKWGNPATFSLLNLSENPLYTYKTYNTVSPSMLYYGKVIYMDINNDNQEDIIFYRQVRDTSYLNIATISPYSLCVESIFTYKFPFINIFPESISYNNNQKFFTVWGETLTDYPVLEVFKWNREEKRLKEIGIIISKGIDVYPKFKDIDKDGNKEIILSYKDGIRIYKFLDRRYRLIK